ncbi:MAG: hypothetical protein ACM34A_14710 [Bacillota bacterium]
MKLAAGMRLHRSSSFMSRRPGHFLVIYPKKFFPAMFAVRGVAVLKLSSSASYFFIGSQGTLIQFMLLKETIISINNAQKHSNRQRRQGRSPLLSLFPAA